MTLTDYLAANGISYDAFGARLSVTGEAVRLWATGARYPSRKNMHAIVRETGGAVTPNDFLGPRADAA